MALTEKKMFDHKGGFELDDLRGEKLHMVCLKGAELHGVDARDTSLEHVNFVHSKWNHIYFSNVHVNEVQMGGTLFENIRRPDAEVSRFEEEAGTDGWINVEPVRFLTSDLSKAVFESCNLKGVELIDCQVEGMRINGIPVEELLRSYSEKQKYPHVIEQADTETAGQDLPTVVKIPPISIVGVTYDANLTEIEQQQLGAAALEKVRAYKERIPTRLSDDVHLIQVYPMKPNFNPHVDVFTQIIGYLVPEATTPPEELVLRSFPEREYVKATHKGLESELGRTYDLLYGQWMQDNGRQPAGYDFEVWGERYKPDQQDNEIDVHVALAP
ncbi:GyrI-like domain-containing protein [Paenibacillus prosopidis]|uniref:Putative transcriptional regulator YdeE n=1 Tax=Paenibacillus prosopidis TaxID=630520 RepID=A0A368W920_9BACL|nr:GyrI-like domain-containing protein [Paenibacillus prosopidis]RCW49149.1 putative transcriptional regulator YdeE [Paenibacillus prosopidis]